MISNPAKSKLIREMLIAKMRKITNERWNMISDRELWNKLASILVGKRCEVFLLNLKESECFNGFVQRYGTESAEIYLDPELDEKEFFKVYLHEVAHLRLAWKRNRWADFADSSIPLDRLIAKNQRAAVAKGTHKDNELSEKSEKAANECADYWLRLVRNHTTIQGMLGQLIKIYTK